MRCEGDGADDGHRVHGIAHAQLLGSLDELGDELVVERLVDEDPAGSRAHLAGVEEAAPEGALDGGVDVGIVEHDQRVVAAQLQADRLRGVAGELHDALAGGGVRR